MKLKIVVIFSFLFFLYSCNPQEAKSTGECGTNEVFDQVKRSCITDETPRLPIGQTTLINLVENDPEKTFEIKYTDYDGDQVSQCTITDSQAGLRGYIKLQGVLYKTKVTDQSDLTYSLSLVHNPSIVPGAETVDVTALPAIQINIAQGLTSSQQVVNAIKKHPILNTIIDAKVYNLFEFQQEVLSANFQGGLCECINGECSLTLEPATDFDGISKIDYFLTDSDGNSDLKTISIVIANNDQAPVVSDVSTINLVEDQVVTITFDIDSAYDGASLSAGKEIGDIDGDTITSCSISDLDSELNIASACVCNTTSCSVGILPNANYASVSLAGNPNPDPDTTRDNFTLFKYRVTANGKSSNLATVTGFVEEVNDRPTLGGTTNLNFAEEGDGNATTVWNFTLPQAKDVYNETPDADIIYDEFGATPASTADYTISGCLDGTNSESCTLTLIDPDFTGTILIKYRVKDNQTAYYPTSDTDSDAGVLIITISPTNDIPAHAASTLISFSGNESETLDPDTISLTTLATGSDAETSPSDLKYYLADASGNILTSGAGSNGTLANCLNLDGSGTSDLICDYTPTDGNFSGTSQIFYYVIVDDNSPAATSAVRPFQITVNNQSDIPTICEYSRYEEGTREECGINGCVGWGAPQFLPVSHTTENPVIYYDRKSGVCYQSTSTTNISTIIYNYAYDIIAGEKESIVKDKIIINEGGDSVEDSERVYIDLTTLTSSNEVLIKKQNIQFTFTEEDGNIISFKGNDATTVQYLGAGGADVGSGELKMEFVPSSGKTGTSKISFGIVDDGGKTQSVSFDVTVKPQSIIHEGWTKILAKGNKTDKDNIAIIKNSTCSYSLDKCNNGQSCVSSSFGSPSASADYAGVIYKTGNKCFFSTAPGNNWEEFTSFCNISEVPRRDANTVAKCTYSLNQCDSGSACVSSATGSPTAKPDASGAVFRNGRGDCYISTGTTTSDWSLQSYSCDYAVGQCNSGNDCTGSGAPAFNADKEGVFYRDSATGDCYQATDTAGTWVLKNDLYDAGTTCSLGTNNASCISSVTDTGGDGVDAADIESIIQAASNTGKFFYNSTSVNNLGYEDNDNERCWYSDGTTWQQYSSTTEVAIAWNAFTSSGSGAISGHNIYRRRSGEEFDYNTSINKSVISASSREYIDNGTNSRMAPAPNQVYYYEVRPILTISGEDDLEVSTNTSLKNVRLISPPDNFVFAHRWMLNKKICELLKPGEELYEEFNYVCEYIGYGDTNKATVSEFFDDDNDTGTAKVAQNTYANLVGPSYIYDIGSDLLIQKHEMGCPYSSTDCNTNDGSCIDNRAPTVSDGSGTGNQYFYNRSNGTCYHKSGAGAWASISNQSMDNGESGGVGTAAYLPPVANISYTNANAICGAMAIPAGINGISGGAFSNNFELPSRKDQVAYSQWEITASFTNSNATTREEGLALNSASKCNASNASGLEFAFTDNDLPDSNTFYSLPGSQSSSIRSLYTGSEQTRLCESFVGVQDAIGNVAEWTTNYLQYGADFNFDTSNFSLSNDGSSTLNATNYGFDYTTGPCDDQDGDLDCIGGTDIAMTSWSFLDTATYDSNRFMVPVGLPIVSNFSTVDSASPYALTIGTTSGITVDQLHNDFVQTNMSSFTAGQNGYLVSGGGYTDGTSAGTYAFELVEESIATRDDVGMRCILRIPEADYIE